MYAMKLYKTKFSVKFAAKIEIRLRNKDFILKLNFKKAVCIGSCDNPIVESGNLF